LGIHAMHLKHLLDALHLVPGLRQMRLKRLLELRVGRLFDHLRERFEDLVFGIVDIAQRVHEKVIHRFDVLGKQAHGCRLSGWDPVRWMEDDAAVATRSGAQVREVHRPNGASDTRFPDRLTWRTLLFPGRKLPGSTELAARNLLARALPQRYCATGSSSG